MKNRFVITLEATDSARDFCAIKLLLKTLLRKFGLRCLDIRQEAACEKP
jgi:hypothetical protein